MSERPRPGLPAVDLPTRYRIVEEIGSGRTATVWRAVDSRTGRDVAIKVLDPRALSVDADDELVMGRFEREIRSLARLAGTPGVCRPLEVGVDRSRIPWLVTEFMSGGSLASGHRSVTAADCLILFGALAAAHRNDVIHGDPSPANILLDRGGSPVLADFGMAGLGRAGAGGPVGGLTPAYAAPERIRGGAATPASDVHALAASLLDHLLEGDDRTAAVLRRAMSAEPRRRPSAERVVGRLRRQALGSRP